MATDKTHKIPNAPVQVYQRSNYQKRVILVSCMVNGTLSTTRR